MKIFKNPWLCIFIIYAAGLLTLATAGQDTSHQKIPLNAVCAEAIKQVTKRAKDQQINIKSSAEAIEVMGNHQQILNLLSKFLGFLEPG